MDLEVTTGTAHRTTRITTLKKKRRRGKLMRLRLGLMSEMRTWLSLMMSVREAAASATRTE